MFSPLFVCLFVARISQKKDCTEFLESLWKGCPYTKDQFITFSLNLVELLMKSSLKLCLQDSRFK